MSRALLWWLVLAAFWVLLSDNHHADELAAGALAATIGTGIAIAASRRMSPGARIPAAAIGTVPRLAWRLVADSALLLGALWQTVVLRRPVRGRWVSEPIDEADTPLARGHRIFAVVAGSLAPNRVVGDADDGRLVAHQLVAADQPLDPLAR